MAESRKSFYTSVPDPTTFIGVIGGVIVLMVGIGLTNIVQLFFDLNSLVIVLGGTLMATLVHFPLTQLFKMLGRLKVIFFTKKAVPDRVINQVVAIAELSKIEGKLALVKELDSINDSFFLHGVQLIVDKVSPEDIRTLLEDEIQASLNRHQQGQTFFDTMAKYSPGFGLLGTLIGLIKMLSNLKDPDNIGPAMGIALITTFYGVLLSNLVFTPLAGRLEILSLEEAMVKEMILIGIIAIASDDSPLIVKEKMSIFLSNKERKKYDKKTKKQK